MTVQLHEKNLQSFDILMMMGDIFSVASMCIAKDILLMV